MLSRNSSFATADVSPKLPPRRSSVVEDDSEVLKKLIATIPLPMNEDDQFTYKSLHKSPTAQDSVMSSKRGKSLRSTDNVPTLPSRLLSPTDQEKRIFEFPMHRFETNSPSSLDKKQDVLGEAVKILESPPLDPTEPSHTTSTYQLDDIRALVVSRIPGHIKDQLTLEEWYWILEPTVTKGTIRADAATVSSDFTESVSTTNRSDITQDPELATSEKVVYDDAYGDDGEEGMEEQIEDNQESKTEEEGESVSDARTYGTEEETKTQEHDDPTEQERNTPETRKKSWMDPHFATYDIIENINQETKEQESDGCQGSRKLKKSVSFGGARVRWHERILEVHPCTSSGPSVGIGWNFTESDEPIAWRKRGRRFVLSRKDRETIVSDLGYSEREIAKAVRKNLKIKDQRRRTINNLQANVVDIPRVEYMAEKCNRKIRKLQKKFRLVIISSQ